MPDRAEEPAPHDSISVVLSTWNGERHLAAQLDSLLAQTEPPFELVVRDDRSTDRTVALLGEFATPPRWTPVAVAGFGR